MEASCACSLINQSAIVESNRHVQASLSFSHFLGIGSEIVKELARRGGHIIMCCRSVESGEKVKKIVMKNVPKARIDIRQLDLRSFDHVKRLVHSIGESLSLSLSLDLSAVNFSCSRSLFMRFLMTS
jgi:enoyl-[acyl-carrier-protein] reductase (NADH)